jgi:hypothetical protein
MMYDEHDDVPDHVDNDLFEKLVNDVTKTVVVRDLVLPVCAVSCVIASSSWFYHKPDVAAFFSALTIVLGSTLIYFRFKLNSIADRLQKLFEQKNNKEL